MQTPPPRDGDRSFERIGLAEIFSPAAGRRAFEKVRANRGAPGCDGVAIDEIAPVFDAQWRTLVPVILQGGYRPAPLRRVEIPKADGGTRKLGIPSVMDRVVQQALCQAYAPGFDRRFSDHSFAYRPGRSTIDAVRSVQQVLDSNRAALCLHLDIRSFFDQVDHGLVRNRLLDEGVTAPIADLIDGTLKCGVIENGLVRRTLIGIPQGSPVSPLLANVVLDPFDRWLEAQGIPFARYADDVLLVVPDRAVGAAFIDMIDRHLREHLHLELNRGKTRLGSWTETDFLGFGFRADMHGDPRRCVSRDADAACRDEIDRFTSSSARLSEAAREVADFLSSWTVYFRHTEFATDLAATHAHARDRLRELAWRLWHSREDRYTALLRGGIDPATAHRLSGESEGPLPELRRILPDEFFRSIRLGDPVPVEGPERFSRKGAGSPSVTDYAGAIPKRGAKPPMAWWETIRWTLRRLARSRWVRARLEVSRRGNTWFPRPSAIYVEIGGFGFRFRL